MEKLNMCSLKNSDKNVWCLRWHWGKLIRNWLKRKIQLCMKKHGFFHINTWEKVKYAFLCFYFLVYFLWSIWLPSVFLWFSEKSSYKKFKEDQKFFKNMPRELVLIFDKWKTFSENYEPIRTRLWLVYKISESKSRSRLHSNAVEVSYLFWQNYYSNLKTSCHVKPKFLCEISFSSCI